MIDTFQPAILELALIHRCAFCQPGQSGIALKLLIPSWQLEHSPTSCDQGHKSCHLLLCSNVSCSLRMFNLVVSGPWFFSLEFFSKPEYVCGSVCVCMSVYLSKCVCVCACICMYVYVCLTVCAYALYVCVCTCVFMCVWPCGVCMWLYVHVYIILSLLYLSLCFIALLLSKTDWTFFIISFCYQPSEY